MKYKARFTVTSGGNVSWSIRSIDKPYHILKSGINKTQVKAKKAVEQYAREKGIVIDSTIEV